MMEEGAPVQAVWSYIRSFENPQKYKHFVKRCNMTGDGGIGSIMEVTVVSGNHLLRAVLKKNSLLAAYSIMR